jgi:hypothetical protein
MTNYKQHTSSFRDPSGYIYLEKNIVKRKINPIYFKTYKALKDSGFYKYLFDLGLLIPHSELVNCKDYIVLQPDQISFITYPYEWSFNQYKEAALLTLELQRIALNKGFSLKDASAFNIVYYKGKAIFIDTLSFEIYKENKPWVAYKQFIMHFLGPLCLAHYNGAGSLKLMSSFIDGIPLQMLSSMLNFKSKLNPLIYTNIHLLAKFESKYQEDYNGKSKLKKLSKKSQHNIIDSLYHYIKNLKLKETSEWGEYYKKINYSTIAFNKKSSLINEWIKSLSIKKLVDIGGNDGTFVRKITSQINEVLVCDIDNNSVDFNFNQIKQNKERYILPFVLDVLNPSPNIGFNNKERFSFIKRITAFAPDVTMALALIHHITLSGNVTFNMSAEFFSSFSKYLIIEFPTREDSWVQRLLNSKGNCKSHFDFYNIDNFESDYLVFFDVKDKYIIKDSNRVLFFLKRKQFI